MDITTMATLRPEILRRTLTSFRENLFGSYDEHRLIINIDPAGASTENFTQSDVLDVAHEFFGDRIKANLPEKPSYPAAHCWLWSQVQSDWFWNIEEDWSAEVKIPLGDLMSYMISNPWLAIIRLSRFGATDAEARAWNKSFPILCPIGDGALYECPEELRGMLGYSGHPSLINTRWLRMVRRFVMPCGNSEQQVKTFVFGNALPVPDRDPLKNMVAAHMRSILPEWRYCVYADPKATCVVRDIGEDWRRKHKVKKLHGKETWSFE